MALALPTRSWDLFGRLVPVLGAQVRWRNRPNLQRPLPVHYKRKRMIAVCEPVIRRPVPICENVVVKEKVKDETSVLENPYALFLAGRTRRRFAQYPMVAIFHTDSHSGHDLLKARIMLHDSNFPMTIEEKVNFKVVKAAFEGTKWAPVAQLCISKTAFGYCESTDVQKMLKVLKKMPAFHLIGLVYENRLLNKADVDRLAALSANILNLHAQLSMSLTSPVVNLCQNLMLGQVSLTNSLASYASSGGSVGAGKAEAEGTSSSSESDDADTSSSSSDSESDTENPKEKK